MDVLSAYTERGFLHAVTCDSPPGFGERFTTTMVGKGLRVVRRSLQDHVAQHPKGKAKPAVHSDDGLPHVGQAIVHPLLGYAVVSHTVTLDDLPLPVATGPKGSGLVKVGEWRAALDADLPHWLRPAAEPAQVAEVVPEPAPVKATRQLSLFDGGAT